MGVTAYRQDGVSGWRRRGVARVGVVGVSAVAWRSPEREGVVQDSCFIEVLSAGDASRTTGDGVMA